jgi:phospholipid N-methyltransferase
MFHESVQEIMLRYMATARDISLLKNVQTTLGPAQPPIQMLYGTLSPREKSGQNIKVTIHFHLVQS